MNSLRGEAPKRYSNKSSHRRKPHQRFRQSTLHEHWNASKHEHSNDAADVENRIRLLQINVCSFTDIKTEVLRQLLRKHDVDVLLVQELSARKQPFVPIFKNYQRPIIERPQNTKGIAIYLKLGIEWK